MENKENIVLQRLKASIGKELTNSPSALGSWLRGTIRKVEYGSLTIDFKVREDMTNTARILHGGATAAIMDDTMGMTVASLGHESFFATVNLNIDYLSSAHIGEIITATTKINREGRHIVNIDCEIINSEGKLLSKGRSNLFKTVLPS